MPSENYKEKVASRDYSDSAMEERKKSIDAERAARLAMRASPELRWESLLGASHPAVAGHSVSSVPSIALNDLESVVSQPALEGHVVSSVPSPAPNDLEGGVSQPADDPRWEFPNCDGSLSKVHLTPLWQVTRSAACHRLHLMISKALSPSPLWKVTWSAACHHLHLMISKAVFLSPLWKVTSSRCTTRQPCPPRLLSTGLALQKVATVLHLVALLSSTYHQNQLDEK